MQAGEKLALAAGWLRLADSISRLAGYHAINGGGAASRRKRVTWLCNEAHQCVYSIQSVIPVFNNRQCLFVWLMT